MYHYMLEDEGLKDRYVLGSYAEKGVETPIYTLRFGIMERFGYTHQEMMEMPPKEIWHCMLDAQGQSDIRKYEERKAKAKQRMKGK